MKRIAFILVLLVLNSSFQKLQAQLTDSLDIKIGQMILIGFPGTKVDPLVLEEVRSGKVGSLIVFEKNIPLKNSWLELKKINWAYQEVAPIPLFIAIDQEGGRVNRLKEKYGFPRSVTAAKLGTYDKDSVRFYSELTASTLAGLGFNVNFAPVVDLASNPDNPIIAKVERSFSDDPQKVAVLASEVVKQHRKFGVITVLKHFPGHGSSASDTHLGLADVTNTWKQNELYPYQELIDSGFVDAIMTAHIVNRKLDSLGRPGTLSSKIIADLLRGKMKYEGVIFSDDMQMHAITKHYGFEEAIKLAIWAGVDVLTFSNNIQGSQERTVDKVHQIIRNLVETGVISKERIDQSFQRIMRLKKNLDESNAETFQRLYLEEREKNKVLIRQAEQNAAMAHQAAERARELYEKAKAEAEQVAGKKAGKKKKDN